MAEAWRDREEIARRCAAFDKELMADLEVVGGAKYARLCALAHRQCLAAHKLVADLDGTPLYFSKENFSNGCIATVDVTYPSAPFFLLLSPALLRAQRVPILQYASMPRWRWPYAPHDIGTYPLANGQVYGGGERTEAARMPVEECGNMLLLVAAMVEAQEDLDLAREYRGLLRKWAEYLLDKGYDPENQLCTDDFAGHLAHNCNLSLKAILAMGAYAKLWGRLGDDKEAKRFRAAAEKAAKRWVKDAATGDHYRLAFDRPESWSQKYNLVWDALLGLNLFPAKVAEAEVAHYRRIQSPLGLPLDSRRTYTKLDWTVWSAGLTDDRGDFEALVDPLFEWANTTPTRVPLTDWYETGDGKRVGFQARSVVGGMFIRMLYDAKRTAKWRNR